jgi:hypothetical protein
MKKADLRDADLSFAILVQTNLEFADLTDCQVYGIAAWDLQLSGAKQNNLHIPQFEETSRTFSGPSITVDNLEVAQFIHLLLHNQNVRHVIDTVGKKAVLIFGRFTENRKTILNAIRDELRRFDYLPIIFDFEKPTSRDLTETVSTLAHLSRFIIADITAAKSIPQELQAIVPHLPSVAVQPIIHVSDYEYGIFEHFRRYPWVLPLYQYRDIDHLTTVLEKELVAPAEEKVKQLRGP